MHIHMQTVSRGAHLRVGTARRLPRLARRLRPRPRRLHSRAAPRLRFLCVFDGAGDVVLPLPQRTVRLRVYNVIYVTRIGTGPSFLRFERFRLLALI
jgi:hypothetical protein